MPKFGDQIAWTPLWTVASGYRTSCRTPRKAESCRHQRIASSFPKCPGSSDGRSGTLPFSWSLGNGALIRVFIDIFCAIVKRWYMGGHPTIMTWNLRLIQLFGALTLMKIYEMGDDYPVYVYRTQLSIMILYLNDLCENRLPQHYLSHHQFFDDHN